MVDDEGLKDFGLEDGATALEIRTCEEDKEIISEGEHSNHFSVVLRGNVKIRRYGRQLAILGERHVFGVESCFLNQPSSVSARSVDNNRIALYGRDATQFILSARPQMSKGS